jgi:hypothetical protein
MAIAKSRRAEISQVFFLFILCSRIFFRIQAARDSTICPDSSAKQSSRAGPEEAGPSTVSFNYDNLAGLHLRKLKRCGRQMCQQIQGLGSVVEASALVCAVRFAV